MKHSEFFRMTPGQKESYLVRMMPRYKFLKKSLQQELKDYILKSPKLLGMYATAIK